MKIHIKAAKGYHPDAPVPKLRRIVDNPVFRVVEDGIHADLTQDQIDRFQALAPEHQINVIGEPVSEPAAEPEPAPQPAAGTADAGYQELLRPRQQRASAIT